MKIKLDTAGMLCCCWSKLRNAGIENWCYVLVCTNPKYPISTEYQSSIREPFPSHCKIPRQKVYRCRVCGDSIEEAQANMTSEELEKAICEECENETATEGWAQRRLPYLPMRLISSCRISRRTGLSGNV